MTAEARTVKRKPNGYWNNKENIEREFWQFVEEHGAERVNAKLIQKNNKAMYRPILKQYSCLC